MYPHCAAPPNTRRVYKSIYLSVCICDQFKAPHCLYVKATPDLHFNWPLHLLTCCALLRFKRAEYKTYLVYGKIADDDEEEYHNGGRPSQITFSVRNEAPAREYFFK